MTETTPTAPSARKCECSVWYYNMNAQAAGIEEADPIDTVDIDTHCFFVLAGGKSKFAQGHDAKLKSLMVAAAFESVDGQITRTGDDGKGMTFTHYAVTDAANLFGFGHQVRAAIRTRTDKAAARALKHQTKEAAKAAKELQKAKKDRAKADKKAEPAAPKAGDLPDNTHTDVQGQVKVGRWWYDITGKTPAGGYEYATKTGEIKVAGYYSETR